MPRGPEEEEEVVDRIPRNASSYCISGGEEGDFFLPRLGLVGRPPPLSWSSSTEIQLSKNGEEGTFSRKKKGFRIST